jgi:hypothetical protein
MSLTTTALLHANFSGKNGSGAISISGLKVGDFVLNVFEVANSTSQPQLFEAVVSVADQLQQTSGTNQSANTFDAVIARLP